MRDMNLVKFINKLINYLERLSDRLTKEKVIKEIKEFHSKFPGMKLVMEFQYDYEGGYITIINFSGIGTPSNLHHEMDKLRSTLIDLGMGGPIYNSDEDEPFITVMNPYLVLD